MTPFTTFVLAAVFLVALERISHFAQKVYWTMDVKKFDIAVAKLAKRVYNGITG